MHDLPEILDALRKLNEIELPPHPDWVKALGAEERSAQTAHLREKIPTALLGHHDRMVARKKRSLAKVTAGGACGACFLRLPTGHHRAKSKHDLDVCDYCGVFLEWPGEPASAAEETRPAEAKKRAAKSSRKPKPAAA